MSTYCKYFIYTFSIFLHFCSIFFTKPSVFAAKLVIFVKSGEKISKKGRFFAENSQKCHTQLLSTLTMHVHSFLHGFGWCSNTFSPNRLKILCILLKNIKNQEKTGKILKKCYEKLNISIFFCEIFSKMCVLVVGTCCVSKPYKAATSNAATRFA